MLKLYDIFLRKFIILFAFIFILLGAVVYYWTENMYVEQTKNNLLSNITTISLHLMDIDNVSSFVQTTHFKNKIKKFKDLTKIRITIIDKKGVVLLESHKDKDKMDNHLNREEIIASKYQNYGSTIRYSNTLKKDFLYVAKMFENNNNIIYIRMSKDIEQINNRFLSLSLKVGLLFIFFIILAFLIAFNMSIKIEDEIKSILKFLNMLTKQTKASKITLTYSQEFNKMSKILTQVSSVLAKKDKQKLKNTAKLKLANRQKDDIISAISHEFKNPIAVIHGYTQTLQEDKDINPNIRDKFLEKIASNTDKLTYMIDRLRLSIKLDDGKQKHQFHLSNISNITQNAIDDLKTSYPNRKIILNLKKEIMLNCDDTLIGIAIINLIENALKYSTDVVNVKLNENSLDVIDKGIGLKEEEITKITKKFYRVSNNTWNNSMGVGLSLVSNILSLHKFKLNIKSIENEGSIFSIKFKS
ncbi:MAG: ATP-binding protein [Campylobacterota bacterium]|nr:ATP-binding protein [Campylobacterota bacterium]